jgi:hypothetical protein
MHNETVSQRVAGRTSTEDKEALRRLAKASLSQAIEDAGGRGLQPAYSAIRWLAGHTTEGLTFQRCCELIGIAPHVVRRSLRRRYRPIGRRLEKYLHFMYPTP